MKKKGVNESHRVISFPSLLVAHLGRNKRFGRQIWESVEGKIYFLYLLLVKRKKEVNESKEVGTNLVDKLGLRFDYSL